MSADPRALVARTFILLCGGADSPLMEAAVMAWLIQENGSSPTITRNNPWNLHSDGGLPGQTGSVWVGPGDRNVAVFDTVQHGVAACVANLVAHGSDFAGYDHVLAAVRKGDPIGFLDALARSSWSAGRYGGPGAGNQLTAIYRRLTAGVPTGGDTVSLAAAKALIAKGRSAETDEYVEQLFALDAYPDLAKSLVGWPSEAMSVGGRRQFLAQTVAAIIGCGPHYGPTLLTCGQVVEAHLWAYRNPGWNLEPTYLHALNRAAKVAHRHAADDPLPWGTMDAPVTLVDEGNYGTVPVSGYYGTGDGAAPA